MTLHELEHWMDRLDGVLGTQPGEVHAAVQELYGELVRDCVRSMNMQLEPQLVREIEALRQLCHEVRGLIGLNDSTDAALAPCGCCYTVPDRMIESWRELCHRASQARQRRGVRTVEEEG